MLISSHIHALRAGERSPKGTGGPKRLRLFGVYSDLRLPGAERPQDDTVKQRLVDQASVVDELSLDEANARLAAEGYPPIQRLPADPAALASWKRIVDARRELDETGKLSDATFVAISSFCHCYKCPSYPRGERAVYCLSGKAKHWLNPANCLCPSCEVYKMGQMQGTNYYCMTGAPGKKLASVGGALGVAVKLLDMEIGKGNPGRRIPERLMAPPSLVGATQDDITAPVKVPGS